jgi:hypothetical protein
MPRSLNSEKNKKGHSMQLHKEKNLPFACIEPDPPTVAGHFTETFPFVGVYLWTKIFKQIIKSKSNIPKCLQNSEGGERGGGRRTHRWLLIKCLKY